MACGSIRMSVHPRVSGFHFHVPLSSASLLPIHHNSDSFSKLRNLIRLAAAPSLLPKASPRIDGPTDYDDGVTLGTVKLPVDTDLQRFDSLLFQVTKQHIQSIKYNTFKYLHIILWIFLEILVLIND